MRVTNLAEFYYYSAGTAGTSSDGAALSSEAAGAAGTSESMLSVAGVSVCSLSICCVGTSTSSMTLPIPLLLLPLRCDARKKSNILVQKKASANMVVNLVRNEPEPFDPKTVADAPAPKAAPASAPLPC